MTPLGITLFPEVPPQNHLPVGGELLFTNNLSSEFVRQSLSAGKSTVTIVASVIHDGKIPVNDWKNFNYSFNSKEQLTLGSDTDYDLDLSNPANPLGSPWSGASNIADANGFSPFSPRLILEPQFPSVHEGFDYSPPGANLAGASGGTAFAEPWGAGTANASYRIAADSLPYPRLVTAGNRVIAGKSDAGITNIGRKLSTPLGQPGTTQYLSFVVRAEGTLNEGQFNGFFGLRLETASGGDLFVGKPGGGAIDQFAMENVGGTLQHASGTTVEVGEEYLLVLRADFTTGNDVFTLYVNPMPGAPEPSNGTLKDDFNFGIFNEIFLYSTGAFSIDEIRIGTDYADVVPFQPLHGDYNQNGAVDAADFTVWRDCLGDTASLPNDDTPGVGQDDYDRWMTHFGQTGGSGSKFTVVPEPAGFLQVIAATLLTTFFRRSGRPKHATAGNRLATYGSAGQPMDSPFSSHLLSLGNLWRPSMVRPVSETIAQFPASAVHQAAVSRPKTSPCRTTPFSGKMVDSRLGTRFACEESFSWQSSSA